MPIMCLTLLSYVGDGARGNPHSLTLHACAPNRYDGLVIMSSETGTVDVAPERIKRKSRLRPGQMFLVDLVNGRVIEDAEIKGDMCKQFPYVIHPPLLDNVERLF